MGTEHTSYKYRVQIHSLRDLGWTIAGNANHLNLNKGQVQYLVHQPETPRKRCGRPQKLTTPR